MPPPELDIFNLTLRPWLHNHSNNNNISEFSDFSGFSGVTKSSGQPTIPTQDSNIKTFGIEHKSLHSHYFRIGCGNCRIWVTARSCQAAFLLIGAICIIFTSVYLPIVLTKNHQDALWPDQDTTYIPETDTRPDRPQFTSPTMVEVITTVFPDNTIEVTTVVPIIPMKPTNPTQPDQSDDKDSSDSNNLSNIGINMDDITNAQNGSGDQGFDDQAFLEAINGNNQGKGGDFDDQAFLESISGSKNKNKFDDEAFLQSVSISGGKNVNKKKDTNRNFGDDADESNDKAREIMNILTGAGFAGVGPNRSGSIEGRSSPKALQER